MLGQKISHYKILNKLGEGGIGEVYFAEDSKLKRKVALKFLSSRQITNAESRLRFQREAQAAAALNHPNIVTIYEIGEFENLTFIAMEYIEGKTLRMLINEGTLDIEKSVNYASQLCEGLEKAHQAGIVHRDIKPENIIIDYTDRVKILDFGLAKLKNVSQLTKESATLGTVKYMSPEQTRGEAVDYRTDIWSLGVILFEMLSGRVPFGGDYEQAVIYSILNENPPRLSDLDSRLPAKLLALVNKSLEKQTDRRYASITEVKQDLAVIHHAIIGDNLNDVQFRKARFSLRKRSVFIPLILLMVMIIIGVTYVMLDPSVKIDTPDTLESRTSLWENSIAVLPFEDISKDEDHAYFCDGMTEQIISNLSRIDKLKVISRTSVMKFKNGGKTIPEIGALLNVNYVLEGSIRRSDNRIRVTAQLINTKNDFHVWSQDYDKHLTDIFDLQDSLSEAIIKSMIHEISPGELKLVRTKRTDNIEAYEYFLKGKYYHEKKFIGSNIGDESFNLAEMMFKKSFSLDSTFTLPYTALADLYHSYYILAATENEEKQLFYRLMNTYLNKAFDLDSTLAYNYLVKGRIHTLNNKVNKAFISFKKAVQINPNNGWMNNGMALFLFNRGLHQAAKYYTDRAVSLDPLEPHFYVYRGMNHQWLGEMESAESDYLKALQLAPDLITAIENYIHLLIENSRFEEAERYLTGLDESRPGTYFLQAKLLAAKGYKKEALRLLGDNRNFQIFGLLGLTDAAAELYGKALEQEKSQKISYYWLYKTNPCYNKLREDPGFQAYLAEHKKILEANLKDFGGPL